MSAARELCRQCNFEPADDAEAERFLQLLVLRHNDPQAFDKLLQENRAELEAHRAKAVQKEKAELYERYMRGLGKDPNKQRN
jgi:hypothetical protein